jgi:hypothetical protein
VVVVVIVDDEEDDVIMMNSTRNKSHAMGEGMNLLGSVLWLFAIHESYMSEEFILVIAALAVGLRASLNLVMKRSRFFNPYRSARSQIQYFVSNTVKSNCNYILTN